MGKDSYSIRNLNLKARASVLGGSGSQARWLRERAGTGAGPIGPKQIASQDVFHEGHSPFRELTIAPVDVRRVLEECGLLVDGFPFVVDLDRSQGATIRDAATGRDYLDMFTCFASSPFGFNHPKLLKDPSFLRALQRAAINNPANADLYTSEMAGFAKAYTEVAKPPEMERSFFISGGDSAVTNALKAAMDWKKRKNVAAGRCGPHEEKGNQVLHFQEAFHGRGGYGVSITNTDPVKTDDFAKFDWPRISNPKLKFPITEQEIVRVAEAEKIALDEIKEAFSARRHDICAVLIEPIQAEGGDNHFRPEFLRALYEITRQEEALLIFDEIQTGVGLTGSMWFYQQLGFSPDGVAFAKKMQVGGCMFTNRIDEVEDNVFRKSSRINSTWGGNLADMVRCAKNLQIIRDDNLVDNAAKNGSHLLRGLENLAEEFDGLASNARGRGLMCAFDLPTRETRNDFLARARNDENMIVLPCGDRSIRYRPALNVTEADLNEALRRSALVLHALA